MLSLVYRLSRKCNREVAWQMGNEASLWLDWPATVKVDQLHSWIQNCTAIIIMKFNVMHGFVPMHTYRRMMQESSSYPCSRHMPGTYCVK